MKAKLTNYNDHTNISADMLFDLSDYSKNIEVFHDSHDNEQYFAFEDVVDYDDHTEEEKNLLKRFIKAYLSGFDIEDDNSFEFVI